MSSRKNRSAGPVEPPSDKPPVQRPKTRKTPTAPPRAEPSQLAPARKPAPDVQKPTAAPAAESTVRERLQPVLTTLRRYRGVAVAAVLAGFGRAKTFIMSSRRNQIAGLAALAVLLVLVMILLASGGDEDDKPADQAAAGDTNTAAKSSSARNAGDAPHVIAWENRASGGRLLRLESEDLPQELFVAEGNTHVQRCGHNYTLADQHALIVFAGSDRGDLVIHPLDGTSPTVIGQTARLTCAGPDELQISSNGRQIVYLQFDSNTPRRYRAGNLVIYDAADQQETVALDQAAAFAIAGRELIALRFYPNGEGDAAAADIDRWRDGAIQNISTMTPQKPADQPDAECIFASGDLVIIENEVWALLGESCNPGGSHWRVVKLPVKGGTLTDIATGGVGGGFYPDNFSAQILPAADGAAALIAIPSGLERHIVQLIWVMEDGTQTPVVEFALADRIGLPTVEGRHLLLSPDGDWLAVIQVTRNREQSLRLINLSQPGSEGQELIALGANEQVMDYRWGPGGRLYFIAGPDTTNTLYVAVPGSEATRISRGQYSALEPDSSGKWIAVAEWVEDPDQADQSLGRVSLIDLNGEQLTVWQAGESGIEVLPLGVE